MLKRKLRTALGTFVAVALMVLAGRASAADDSHTLTVRLDWLPSGYHAPIWLAVDKGWFKKAGLDLSISDGNGSATTAQLVGTGQYDVGWAALSNMAFARSKGMPVISVAGLFRKGDLALLVPQDSPIHSPKDLKGKSLITTPGSLETPFLDAFFSAGGLSRADVELLNVDASAKVTTYVTGKGDGVFTSTAYTLPVVDPKRATRPILFADFGLNVPGFGIFTTTSILQKKADAIRKFASIICGSWSYVLAGHEDEAVKAVLHNRQEARLDEGLVLAQLKASIPFLHTEASAKLPIGIQDEQDWSDAIKAMEQAKMIDAGTKPKDYYTNDYLDSALLKNPAGT